MTNENAIGITTESLLATVVTEIPAVWLDFPMIKNIRIKRIPITTARGNQAISPLKIEIALFPPMINPSKEATK
jgi:hypothetical protein